MHEEATSMSVPSSVAASTTQNENGTTPTVSVVTAEVELNNVTVDNDNVDLQVPFSSNSGGNSKQPQICHSMIHTLLFSGLVHPCLFTYAFVCATNPFPLKSGWPRRMFAFVINKQFRFSASNVRK